MDQIRVPDQAVVRRPREIHDEDNDERQFQLVPLRYRGEAGRSYLAQDQYIDLLWAARLIFNPQMLKLNYPRSLPFFNTQPTQHLSTQNIPLSPLGPTLQNTHVRRRHKRSPQTIKSVESMNPSTEEVGKKSGAKARKWRWSVIDTRIASHERREKELMKILDAFFGLDDTHSSILVCWGKEESCRFIPVKIPNSADDVTVWQEIHRRWYAHRGWWRKYLPLFGIKKVEIVEVRRIQSVGNIANAV